ncbi:MAG: hypothetical protein AAFY98_08125 [Verrucomicrobiota bacterium]
MNKTALIYAISGLLLNGLGLSLFGESVIRKSTNEPWFILGTLSLVCINAGICLVIEAAKKA